jgi:hypothetical protein
MPQSTIATNIQILEESDLIDTEIGRARKGQQKICAARFDEIVIRLDGEETSREKDIIEVEMPLGHGDSAKPHDAAAYPPDVLVDDGLALIVQLGLTDCDLGGYSLGGLTVCVEAV